MKFRLKIRLTIKNGAFGAADSLGISHKHTLEIEFSANIRKFSVAFESSKHISIRFRCVQHVAREPHISLQNDRIKIGSIFEISIRAFSGRRKSNVALS